MTDKAQKSKDKSAATEILTDALTQGSRIMVVGAMSMLDGFLRDCGSESIVSIAYASLTPVTVAKVRPDLVLAPLLGAGFDIVDIGARLAAMGYRARLRAVTPPLPDAAAVVRELSMQFRDLDFALVELAGEPGLSS